MGTLMHRNMGVITSIREWSRYKIDRPFNTPAFLINIVNSNRMLFASSFLLMWMRCVSLAYAGANIVGNVADRPP